MTFADEMEAVSEGKKRQVFSPAEKRTIVSSANSAFFNIWDNNDRTPIIKIVLKDGQERNLYLGQFFRAQHGSPSIGVSNEDIERVYTTPDGAAKILYVARNARKGLLTYSTADARRPQLGVYLTAEFLRGKLLGYDRVSHGVYSSPNAPIRKTIRKFVKINPQDAEWAINMVQNYTWQPAQLNLDFGRR